MGNRHVSETYLDAWNRHDSKAIQECFHSNGVYIDANLDEEVSAEQFALRAQELFNCFPNLRVSTTSPSQPTEGLIATPWRISGAIPNKDLCGVDMLCVRENKLQSVQVYFNHATGRLFAQVPSLHLSYRVQETSTEKASTSKYRTSGLTPEDMQKIKKILETAVNEQRIHLQPDISLSVLANNLGITTNHLSQVINSCYQCNFYEFINQHRITHACQLIKNNKISNSLDLSLESGFRSTSTFYTAFKKETGLTPSKYRQT